MLQIRYFSSAWNDINHTPGWFGKMCLLGLISLIPIFGAIVLNGYLYGWAREIAWGVHEPMPARIFGNEDGKLYRRGFSLFIFNLVFALLVSLILSAVALIPGMVYTSTYSGGGDVSIDIATYSFLYYVIYIALILVEMFIVWIGSMRISVYGRLSAGFQLGKIWKMFKHEPGGLWRILGMQLIIGFIIGIVLSIVFTIVLTTALIGAFSGGIGALGASMSDYEAAQYAMSLLMTAGPVFIIALIAMVYVAVVASVFLSMLTARALGYWTMQFDVPRWRSQDEPMPFENEVAPF